ncbi:MAG TPA: vWA domain-containing protein, partial [Planctomycetota bacterium]|nr:vWA domain-containing protein [Planctomycetota bacterium]
KTLPNLEIRKPTPSTDRSVLAVPDGFVRVGGPRVSNFVPTGGDIGNALRDGGLLDVFGAHERSLAVWLFDESRSMKDDQQIVRQRVDDLYRDLGVALHDPGQTRRLVTAVASYGKDFHVILRQPTNDINKLKEAIEKIRIDETGQENYLTGINGVLNEYGAFCRKYRRHLIIIMVTDEGGDDDKVLEDERTWVVDATAARMKKVGATLIVFGSEAGAFAYGAERTYDPTVPKQYSPYGWVNRGTDTAFDQMFPMDWRFRRTGRVPSGFGPYGPSRICRETGGIFYLLRAASARNYDYEKLLSGYEPELDSRLEIARRNARNPVRRVVLTVVDEWKRIRDREEGSFRYTFSNDPALKTQIIAAMRAVDDWIAILTEGIRRMEAAHNVTFEFSPKHWDAYRDLMTAQMYKLRFQLVQYKLAMNDLARNENLPPPGDIGWVIHPWGNRLLRGDPERINAEKVKITQMYQKVIDKHVNTPWEVFARSEMRDLSGWAIHPYSRSGPGGPSKPSAPQ